MRHLNSDDSETGRLVQRMAWERTPLGPMARWPQSLKTSLSICLTCRFPIILWWGPEMVVLYNDDYIPVLGARHPAAMGGVGREVWADVWPVVGPMLDSVVCTGKASRADDLLLLMRRHADPEETYFSFSYSPILDESGGVGGIFTPVIETTEKVVGQRRIETLRRLGSLPHAADLAGACTAAAEVLADAVADLPFGALYAVDADGRRATRTAAFGLDACPDLAPAVAALDADDLVWPLRAAAASGTLQIAGDLGAHGVPLPAGAWGAPVQQAVVLPVSVPGQAAPAVLMVAGVSPHRPLDDNYIAFYKLLADQLQRAAGEALSFAAERQRVEALAEIDRAKTTFFSNVSHEFRTPLTLMLAPLDDLRQNPALPAAAREQADLVRRNGRRLLKLVNALLDFSRIEAGRMAASFAPLDLAACTSDLAGVFRAAVEHAGLALEVDCRPVTQPIFADRGMWEKIVLNLVSNAFKFTFSGGIAVRLLPRPDHVELQVADTGVGIAAADLPLVFERFRRIEGARARTHEGTGIGLALVRDLVELHGGSIAIESEPGRGTTVHVRLRYGSAHLPPEQVRTTPAQDASCDALPDHAVAYAEEAELWLRPPAAPAPAAGTAGTAFVVDDNADMRDYIANLLTPRYRVRQFTDGATALAAAHHEPPAVVVSDVMMPVMDGYALLAALKSDRSLRHLPVLLLSARAGEEARVSGMQAGADDYLEKPFSGQELVARIDNLVLRAQVRRAEVREARHMETVFQQAPVAIAILRGPDHVYELANPLYRDIVGGREVVGLPVRQALPELEQHIFDLLDQVYRSGEPYVGRAMRVDFLRGDPPALQECYFDFVFQPMTDGAGAVEGIAVVAFEVTATIQAKQAAEVASRAKDEFMAMLGHELRNPLAPIMTALQLMKLRNVREAEHERAIIERQAQHLVGLVDDLLDVARVARGKVELRREVLELAEVVADAVETATPLLEERQHRLQVDVPAHGLQLYGDRHRLCQIVANLLTNAAKYSDNGGRVTLRGWREDEDLLLEVRDAGHGIEAGMLPHIFEMFYQDQQTLARSRGGLGLGLTIVRSLVELHGGTVTAHSAGRGQGSTFTVRLPALESAVREGMLASGAAANDNSVPGPQTLSILIVDDNVDAARTLRDLLQSLGHRVEVAFDAPTALLQLETEVPDLAFLDIGLPGIDGYELARRAQAMAGTADMRLVALTGYGQDSDRARAADAGFDEHVVKPLTMAKLQQLLARFGSAEL